MAEQKLGQENLEKQENFCSLCGLNLKPPSSEVSSYISRSCTKCEKTIYVPPSPVEDGSGFIIRDGESLHCLIEPFSLRPKRRGFLTRHGVMTSAKMLLAAGEPLSEAELELLIEFYKNKAEFFLKKSPLLDGLDLDNESHTNEICKRVTHDKERREFTALKMLVYSQLVEESLKDSNTRQAIWAMYQACLSHCFFEMEDYDFEETLWQGHQAHKFLTSVQDVSAQTPAQAQAIERLRLLFENQSELTLHTWVEDEHPIGEIISVSELPEKTLRAMAKYYLDQFERKRQEAQQAKEDKRKEEEAKRQNRMAWNPVVAACIIACTSVCNVILGFLMNKFIFPH